MKHLIAVLLLMPVLSFGQNKKDTKITVAVSDTTKLFDKVINLLYTEDYILKVDDKAHGIMITEQRPLKKDAATLVIYKLKIDGSIITLTGQAALNASISFGGAKTGITFFDVYYGGGKGSVVRNAWNEMDRLAKLLGTVAYSK